MVCGSGGLGGRRAVSHVTSFGSAGPGLYSALGPSFRQPVGCWEARFRWALFLDVILYQNSTVLKFNFTLVFKLIFPPPCSLLSVVIGTPSRVPRDLDIIYEFVADLNSFCCRQRSCPAHTAFQGKSDQLIIPFENELFFSFRPPAWFAYLSAHTSRSVPFRLRAAHSDSSNVNLRF